MRNGQRHQTREAARAQTSRSLRVKLLGESLLRRRRRGCGVGGALKQPGRAQFRRRGSRLRTDIRARRRQGFAAAGSGAAGSRAAAVEHQAPTEVGRAAWKRC
eukprot:4616811-Pleurochrysis_carterae.AAC.1